MSQHDMDVANGPGLTFRTDMNAALQALASQSSGAAEPSPIFPCQVWADIGTGRLKQRNVANTAWIDRGPLNTAMTTLADYGITDAFGKAAGDAAVLAITGLTTRVGTDGGLGFRNKLINGRFGVNQRGYVSGVATTTANQCTLDRWWVVVSGQNLSFSANKNGNQVVAPAGGLEQIIEDINIEGGVYTLNWIGTAVATVNGIAIAKGGSTASLPAKTNVTIRFSGGTVAEAQFELGTSPTPFEARGISIELLLCKRYFETMQATQYREGGAARQSMGAPVSWSVEKRVSPTIILGTASGASNIFSYNVNTPNKFGCLYLLQQDLAGITGATLAFSGNAEFV
ncbi:hypothetical protein [Pseudomonas fluorescens group sp. PF-69]